LQNQNCLFFPYFHFVQSDLDSDWNWSTDSHFLFRNHVFQHYSLTIADSIITCRTKVVQFFCYFHVIQSNLNSDLKWPTGRNFVFQNHIFQHYLLTIADRLITSRTKVVHFFVYFHFVQSHLHSDQKWLTGQLNERDRVCCH